MGWHVRCGERPSKCTLSFRSQRPLIFAIDMSVQEMDYTYALPLCLGNINSPEWSQFRTGQCDVKISGRAYARSTASAVRSAFSSLMRKKHEAHCDSMPLSNHEVAELSKNMPSDGPHSDVLHRSRLEPPATTIPQYHLHRRSWLRFPESSIKETLFKGLTQSWAHFLEDYGRGQKNLSEVSRPSCFNDYGFMTPPEAQNEHKRNATVRDYCDRKQWRKRAELDLILRPLLAEFNMSCVCVSVVDRTQLTVKYQTGSIKLPPLIARNLSLDGHAILSNGPMTLLNAPHDWRTMFNPFVHGPPFIRFYAGEALRAPNGHAIGAVSVLDPYVRFESPAALSERLQMVANQVMALLEQEAIPTSRIESASEGSTGWFDDRDTASDISSRYSPYEGFESAVYKSTSKTLSGESSENVPQRTTLFCDSKSLRRLNCHTSHLQNYEILKALMDCSNKGSAAQRAARILGRTIALDVTYVLEVKVTRVYTVSRPVKRGDIFLPNSEEVVPTESDANLKFIGGYQIDIDRTEFDERVHVEALESDLGMQYCIPEGQAAYCAGIFMPMKRSGPTVVSVHRKKLENEISLESLESSSTARIKSQSPVNLDHQKEMDAFGVAEPQRRVNQNLEFSVKTRLQGYVMAGFGTNPRAFSPAEVDYMKVCARALESIFGCTLKNEHV